ncbi:hypothetical protein Tco_1502759 [Tanacetum coccineum]
MEILLVSSSNSTTVGDLQDSIRVKLLLAGNPEQVRLQVDFLRSSTTPTSSPGPSTSPSDSSGLFRNAECSNCKLLLGKIKVLEATLEMYMHPEQHTLDSTALLHEVYNDIGKLGLEYFVI